MTVEVRSPADFTLDSLRRVVIGGEEVRLVSQQPQPTDTTTAHLPRSPAVPELVANATAMDGEYLPDRVTRGVLFAWLAGLLAEGRRLRPGQAEQVAALLNGPPPGLLRVAGTGAWFLADALTELAGGDAGGLRPAQASALASAALVGDSALQASGRLLLAEGVFALSVEAYDAPLDAYDEALASIWGDNPHDAAALSALRWWLTGALTADRLSYQAPVSYRILPRVLGQAHRAVATTEQAADTLPGWNSQHANLDMLSYALAGTSALDMLAAAWADLATLAGHHMAKLFDGTAPHLPKMLIAPATQAPPGARSSTWQTEYASLQAEYGEKARQVASSSFLSLAETGGGPYNYIAAPTLSAYDHEQRAATSLSGSLAILAVVASQALFVAGKAAPPQLQELVRCVRDECPPVELSGPAPDAVKLQRLASVFEAAARDHAGPAAQIRPKAAQTR